ncbi:SpoIIE family protein phosphatase [Nocardioides mesophilus]|uniref:SpoIIE family protein phosphatase n=1 Tax=Nocardioides mesophilus TaxID=433659 RepID=A0A7G9R7P2_9ACTN|nr:SpoIIE family protein phosphatase [Nocardioides mesophilus]QNN51617.1 SpoIIE family protein phosphatase [Nocardioides mesophilus]
MRSAGGDAGRGWREATRVLDGVMIGALAVDGGGTLTYCNAAAVALLGRQREELLGRDIRDLLFEEPEHGAVEEVLRHLGTGQAWAGELPMVRAGGLVEPLATSWSPLTDGEGVVGALLIAEEAAGSGAHARRLAARLRRLAAVTTELLVAETVEAVSAIVTGQLADTAGATVSSLSTLVDDETLALIAMRGGRHGAASRWATYPLAASTPAGDTIRSGRMLVLRSSAEIAERYPTVESAADGERSMVCLPLQTTGGPLGVVTLSFPGRRALDAAELEFLGILADVCAQTLDRIRAVAAAADRESKLQFLADASEQLSSSLDYRATLRRVADLAVPWFADWCAIQLLQDGELRTLSIAHEDSSLVQLVEDLQTKYPPPRDGSRGAYKVLATGESELVPEVTDELLAVAAVDEEHLRLLRTLNFRSGLAVPLKVQDRVLGVITWVAGDRGRRFGRADQAFGEDLARRAAIAIDNSQLHSELRDVALKLQHAVLPAGLPKLDDVELAVCYQPAGRTDAGGDFYDVLPLDEGRLAVFVGDVMGRGVQAASAMAQMRSAVRTLVALDPEPATVMTGLDVVFDKLDMDQLVTVVYAVVDPARQQVRVINAGHPAPLVLGADGSSAEVTTSGTLLLGVGGGRREVVTAPLRDEDTLLLFTDGLVERRGEDLEQGSVRLRRAAVELLPPRALDEGLPMLVEAVRDPDRDDDVAALAVRPHRRG